MKLSTPSRIGVILVNLGSPSTPTPQGVSQYLWQFLRDKRVVDLPSWKWLPLLRGIILPHRAKRVAKSYQEIWTPQGSLLIAISRQQQTLLQRHLTVALANKNIAVQVELAMTYGKPSFEQALQNLEQGGTLDKLIVLPLFPQYSSTTTAAVFDAFNRLWQTRRNLPAFEFIHHYATHPAYIDALVASIQRHRKADEHLLFSYHGIPERYVAEGDYYPTHCEQTTQAVVNALGLRDDEWSMTYQSRFGRETWLTPYTDEFLKARGEDYTHPQAKSPRRNKIEKIAVICPGFASDCLETIEEIDQENRQYFLNAGGKTFRYIPALNAHPRHIQALTELVLARCE